MAAAICLPFTAAEADDLQKIENAGKLSVALCGAFQPFSFVDKNNQVVGFDVDIGSEIARRLGARSEYVRNPELQGSSHDAIVADDVPVFVAIPKSNAPVEQVKDDNLPRYDIGISVRKKQSGNRRRHAEGAERYDG